MVRPRDGLPYIRHCYTAVWHVDEEQLSRLRWKECISKHESNEVRILTLRESRQTMQPLFGRGGFPPPRLQVHVLTAFIDRAHCTLRTQ
eukprot:5942043-Pyramimonas_sp.AAC.1